MDRFLLETTLKNFLKESGTNTIDGTIALDDESVGLQLFDEPLVGFAAADNEYLLSLKTTPEANIDMEPPEFWLPEAKTVISFFLPFTNELKNSNIGGSRPSFQWLHGRIEGQSLVIELLEKLKNFLENEGYKAVIPVTDKKFWAKQDKDTVEGEFGSNWSERHVAYAAGLGTFSLSKNLITEKGVAGRLGSLVTSAYIEPTIPPYTELEEYCLQCCICGHNCPVDSITWENGKAHKPCSDYILSIRAKHDPYYGCGKCQVDVPCMSQNPSIKID